MGITRTAVLAGTAAILLAGYAGLAAAQTQDGVARGTHVLTLRLPDGRLEQVRYVGDVPPTVELAADPMPAPFDPGFPFAMLRQMTAAMDQEAAALLRNIDAMTSGDAGFEGMVPVLSGPGVCIRSVQITYADNGKAPHIVSRTAGDCGTAAGTVAPAVMPSVPERQRSPRVIEANAGSAYQGLLHPVSDWRR